MSTAAPSLQSILDPSHPLAYLAYLPPEVAYEVTIAVYVLIGALSIQIWDILNNLSEDYKILVKRRISFPNIVYCISRIFTLAYLLYAIIYETTPIGNCEKLSKIGPWLICIAVPSTSLLFYFRVTAVYNHNRRISIFFFLLWLCVLGASFTNVVGVAGFDIGPTGHCLNGTLRGYVAAGPIVQVVNDSLVFGAVTFRLMQVGLGEEREMRLGEVLRVIVYGKDLPAFTRALLRDGQAYYLTTTTVILTTIIIFYINSIPLVYRTIFSIPSITLVNVMACRVYRRTKSGKYRENTTMELPLSFVRASRAGGVEKNRNNAVGLVDFGPADMGSSMSLFVVAKRPGDESSGSSHPEASIQTAIHDRSS